MYPMTYVQKSRAVLAMLFCCTLIFSQQVQAQDDADIALLDRSAKAFASVVKKASPAVVHVAVEKSVSRRGITQAPLDFFNDPFFERFFGEQFRNRKRQKPRQYKQQGAGSGFIFAQNGYILTNNHVVEDAEKITVRLADKREYEAKVIGTDPQSDVAVIKIDGNDLPVLPLGNSDALEVGEWVIAIGSPFELNQTVTVGVVSAKGRNRVGITDYENFIQTDAAINPGNSGGPLLNIHGEAVGVNTAIFSRSGGYMGIGFAIPINMAKAIKQQLLDNGKVIRGWLGVIIQDMDKDLAKSFRLKDTKGVLISEITKDSPADKAGLKEGDVVVAINDVALDGAADLRNKVALTLPGSTIAFEIVRDGHKKTLTVKIGEQPENLRAMTGSRTALGNYGLSLQDLTKELADQFGYEENQGVLITEVDPASSAARTGLKPGHLIEEVNRQRVHSLQELNVILDRASNTEQVLLRVRTTNGSQYVVLQNN